MIPAAAIIADSTTEYVGWASATKGQHDAFVPKSFKLFYGGSFWQDKKTWIEQAPEFNVDRVEIPALFTYHRFTPLLTPITETLVAFRSNDRELDMVLFPEGGYQLQRPKQRQADLQATVDWMSFWLQGHEDPDPARPAISLLA